MTRLTENSQGGDLASASLTAESLAWTEGMRLPNGVPFDKDGNPRKRYVRITYDGIGCVSELADVDAMTEGDSGYLVEDVYLSEQEYEALPEFEGW